VTSPPVVCEDVRYTYHEVVALGGVTKSFAAGAITVIAGPSGSGKSTLLRILACGARPDTGRVALEDVDVARLSARRRRRIRRYRLAYVFQSPADNLLEYLTAAEQVRLAAEIRGRVLPVDEIDRVLATLQLDHRAGHRPAELSGGEQQRLAIACAVVGGPAIVLADEPTAELDSASAARVLDAMRRLRDDGVTFAVTSHDPSVIATGDHLLRLDHGEPVESW
jgi:putative ABC transport system ATP-binding protein